MGYLNKRGKISVGPFASFLRQRFYALWAEGKYTADELRKLATASAKDWRNLHRSGSAKITKP